MLYDSVIPLLSTYWRNIVSVYVCVNVSHICADAHRGQKRSSNPVNLEELQAVVVSPPL